MPESMSYAIATQQAHKTGNTPKNYGTAEGKRVAKAKYQKPSSEYTQTADPSSKSKSSAIDFDSLMGFFDELQQIPPPTLMNALPTAVKTAENR